MKHQPRLAHKIQDTPVVLAVWLGESGAGASMVIGYPRPSCVLKPGNSRKFRPNRRCGAGNQPVAPPRMQLMASGHELSELFSVSLGQKQRSDFAARLGCKASDEEGVQADPIKSTTEIPGLFIAGDASKDVQQVIVAAAEGTQAAFEINAQLRDEEYL